MNLFYFISMKHELRIMVFGLLFMILASLFMIHPAYARDCNDPAEIAKFGPCPSGLAEIEQVFANVISVIVGLGFVAMLVWLIMAGFKYLTSGGEPKAVQSAHQTATWALLGVVFMAIAWLILQLIHTFTGIDVTIFNFKVLCGIPVDLLKFCTPKP